ncbi:MAG: hypothetical protein U9Q15_01380 [Patescibacteria group bacterium]|nr:hypothetical protein [Patescibacteria group bacterium]
MYPPVYFLQIEHLTRLLQTLVLQHWHRRTSLHHGVLRHIPIYEEAPEILQSPVLFALLYNQEFVQQILLTVYLIGCADQ